MLIDNSKTFRYQKTLLNDLNATGTGTHARFWGVEYDENRKRYPTRYPPELIERLRRLENKELKNAIKKFVWGQNRKLVEKRLELILERIESMEAESVAIEPTRPAGHANLGVLTSDQGRHEEAIKHFRTALRLAPGAAESYLNLAAALVRAGRWQQATDQYRRCVETLGRVPGRERASAGAPSALGRTMSCPTARLRS